MRLGTLIRLAAAWRGGHTPSPKSAQQIPRYRRHTTGERCRHRDHHRRVDARPCRTRTAQGAASHKRQRGRGYRYGGEDGRRKGYRQYDEVCRRRLSRDKEPRHQRPPRAWLGVQDSQHHGGTRRRSGRHHLSCGDSRRRVADVRQRDERPQLASRRLRYAHAATDADGQLEHRCESHHRRPLPQHAGEVRARHLSPRTRRRPAHTAARSIAGTHTYAEERRARQAVRQLEQDNAALDEHRLRDAGATNLNTHLLQRHRQRRKDDGTALCEGGDEGRRGDKGV